MNGRRLPYVWDYDIDETRFRKLLSGTLRIDGLDRRWAAVRLIEHAPYREVVRLLGYGGIVEGWPEWRPHVRSKRCRRGFDFLTQWLQEKHPELL